MDYVTLRGEGKSELIEKKSVFIGYACRVSDETEAQEVVKRKKREYSDATHNVFAYFLHGGAVARYSDDGEPQGTSGMPVLNVLRNSGADDLCVVVTRYFGGTLLGAGGLVRAYSAAAKSAVDDAGLITYTEFSELLVKCGYSEYQKIQCELPKYGAKTDDVLFESDVIIKIALKKTLTADFIAKINEITAGRASISECGVRMDF